MAGQRPRGRQRNVTGAGKSIKRRGSGLGGGPVGSAGGYGGRPGGSGSLGSLGNGRPSGRPTGSEGRQTRTPRSGGGGLFKLILIALVLFGGGGSILSGGLDLGGLSDMTGSFGSSSQYEDYGSMWGNLGGGNVSTGWSNGSNTGDLDTSVADGAREKYTEILGNGRDEVTVMVYMCGTDLESRSKMATKDLQEMIDADLSRDVNLLIYTGGCKQWQNSAVSSKNNQIWKVEDGGIKCLDKNMGNKSMTDPDTLTEFIKWCNRKYPANRNSLIFWDHGSGTVKGFGYDEKFASSGSMNLSEINKALTKANVKFDFVGFDACLMATTENALMLSKHADYMIASEELEPGIGWYYTDWLTELSEDTSMPTLEVGQKIIDDFVEMCAKKCYGQATTLSIVDLAEAELTIPKALADFSTDTYNLLKDKEYKQVSKARSSSREFASSSKLDQVDLVHLAKNMETKEGDVLADTILDAVKYNRTSSNMTNAYGLSIYFPYRKASMVDSAVDTYEAIGMDDEYARCIQAFASMEVSGQAVSGGTTTPMPSLMDMLGGYGNLTGGTSTGSSSGGAYGNADMMTQILGSFLGGNMSSFSGLTSGNTNFFSEAVFNERSMAEYLVENSFDGSLLQWKESSDGQIISLPEDQWELVQTLEANMFYDDGEGFIDLGLDNVYEFDKDGNLLAPADCTWIAINEQPVAYYHEATVDNGEDYSITGRVPVLYNGDRAELVVEFTDENPYGEVVGVRRVYVEGETETIAKTMDRVKNGDVIDFVCDYYSYDGEYIDSYMFGEQLVVEGDLMISDVYIDEDAANLTYRFTDIYNQQYWTETVK